MAFKRFEGGYLQVTGANSSAGLQMISVRVVIREEVSEYPFDVDGRGDPVDLSDQRTQGWEGREKTVDISTPGLLGTCRITKRYEASDQRKFFVPCPHCGAYQVLTEDHFDKEAVPPVYICAAHGCLIFETSKKAMRRAGTWIKTFPGDGAPGNVVEPSALEALGDRIWWPGKPDVIMDGRQPGFEFRALCNSPTKSWETIVAQYRDGLTGDEKMKVYVQQVQGDAWEATGEAPDEEKIFERRAKYEWRKVPLKALFLSGAADVQGDRLEWAVYAWGLGFTSWLIDKGVIDKDPNETEAWHELTKVYEKTWPDAYGRPWRLDAFGVDAGYLSQIVYRYVRLHASTGRMFALDGRAGWKVPFIGTPVKKDVDYQGRKIGACQLWPIGTWGVKSELYSAIEKLITGADKETGLYPPGTAFYGDACDLGYLQQLAAEQVVEKKNRSGIIELVWEKIHGRRNEGHDIAVYSRALAHHLADGMTPDEWATLAAQRGAKPEDVQRDMAALWATQAGPQAPPPDPLPAESARPHRAEQQQDEDRGGWFDGQSGRFFGD